MMKRSISIRTRVRSKRFHGRSLFLGILIGMLGACIISVVLDRRKGFELTERVAAAARPLPDSAEVYKVRNPSPIVGVNQYLRQTLAQKDKLDAYLTRFAPVAVAESKKFGIPASIILAQGVLESDMGNSWLARNCNNHFGVKCFSRRCGKGHCKNRGDDSHKDFFVNYKSAWASYRAHSQLLVGPHYRHLLKGKGYKAWATGLKAAGYATDRYYAEKLIGLIEGANLVKYD